MADYFVVFQVGGEKRHPIWPVLCCTLLLSLFSALAKSVHVILFFTHFILLSASSNGSRQLQRSYTWTLTPWEGLGTRLASRWHSSLLLLPQRGLVHFGRTVLADSLQRSLLTPSLRERDIVLSNKWHWEDVAFPHLRAPPGQMLLCPE